MLLKEQFIQQIIQSPPPLAVELVASDSHESRDFVDPYIQIFDEELGKIINPSGEIVEDTIEKNTYIGSQEYKAFMQMQDLVNKNDSGIIIWFSPKYPGKYDISKVLFSEILLTFTKKVILNRSITFDCDNEILLNLANEIGKNRFNSLEELRKTSFLVESDKLITITDKLSLITQQVKMLKDNKDLEIKLETYSLLNAMKTSLLLPFYENNYYQQLRYIANQEGLIGTAQGSCGGGSTTKETAFEKISESSQETKLLECKCPFCGKRVFAIITPGSIRCPSCGKSAEYHC